MIRIFSFVIFYIVSISFTLTNAAASLQDIGVIGPQGLVVLYYREGDDIMIRSCKHHTYLGTNANEARNNCKSFTNKISIDSFKLSLRNLISTDLLNLLEPLTPEEVESYIKPAISPEETESILAELEEIKRFIEEYGPNTTILARKEALEKVLRLEKIRVSVNQKVIGLINRIILQLSDQLKVHLKMYHPDNTQFTFSLLRKFYITSKFPCGLEGSIENRIKDCTNYGVSSNEKFVLVSRTPELKEIYKELSTGLLWSEKLSSDFERYNYLWACKSDNPEFGSLSDVNWRLASKEQFDTAYKNGIKQIFSNMNFIFWTSSVTYTPPMEGYYLLWLFSGYDGTFYIEKSDSDPKPVICVGSDK